MRILQVFIECSHNVCGAFCAMGHVVFVEDCPVSKAFHNALQSKPHELTQAEQDLYSQVNEQSAKMLETAYDVFVVHDPQPAALRAFA